MHALRLAGRSRCALVTTRTGLRPMSGIVAGQVGAAEGCMRVGRISMLGLPPCVHQSAAGARRQADMHPPSAGACPPEGGGSSPLAVLPGRGGLWGGPPAGHHTGNHTGNHTGSLLKRYRSHAATHGPRACHSPKVGVQQPQGISWDVSSREYSAGHHTQPALCCCLPQSALPADVMPTCRTPLCPPAGHPCAQGPPAQVPNRRLRRGHPARQRRPGPAAGGGARGWGLPGDRRGHLQRVPGQCCGAATLQGRGPVSRVGSVEHAGAPAT